MGAPLQGTVVTDGKKPAFHVCISRAGRSPSVAASAIELHSQLSHVVGTLTCSSSLRSRSRNGFLGPAGLAPCDKALCRCTGTRIMRRDRAFLRGQPILSTWRGAPD